VQETLYPKPAENGEGHYKVNQFPYCFILVLGLICLSILCFFKFVKTEENQIGDHCDDEVNWLDVANVEQQWV